MNKAETIKKVAREKSRPDVKKSINKFWASTIFAIVLLVAGIATLSQTLSIAGAALLAGSLYFLDLYRAVAKQQSVLKASSN